MDVVEGGSWRGYGEGEGFHGVVQRADDEGGLEGWEDVKAKSLSQSAGLRGGAGGVVGGGAEEFVDA